MRGFTLVTVAMLVWGNLAKADVQDRNSDLKRIWYRMALLNFNQPDLQVHASAQDLTNPVNLNQLDLELQTLEGVLSGKTLVEPGSLKSILCTNPVCDGGGDGGKCHACKKGNSIEEIDPDGTLLGSP